MFSTFMNSLCSSSIDDLFASRLFFCCCVFSAFRVESANRIRIFGLVSVNCFLWCVRSSNNVRNLRIHQPTSSFWFWFSFSLLEADQIESIIFAKWIMFCSTKFLFFFFGLVWFYGRERKLLNKKIINRIDTHRRFSASEKKKCRWESCSEWARKRENCQWNSVSLLSIFTVDRRQLASSVDTKFSTHV